MTRSSDHLSQRHLPEKTIFLTIVGMSELIWIAFLILCWYLGSMAHQHWKRKKEAARLADDMLEKVLKQKDGFRR
ncbi:MAG TPA: hypothetical protein EYO39_10785 [Nitrospirales bacterium]|nr:hypothetical protein [Nitrospirales bacterium]HIN32544.1 hypothetical protein [Nitrospirales bacterium]